MKTTLLSLFAVWLGAAVSFAEQGETAKAQPKMEAVEAGSPERIEVSPSHIQIGSPLQKVQVVVSGFYANGRVQDLTRIASCSAVAPGVVDVKNALVTPLANGVTEMRVEVGGRSHHLPVTVTGQEAPEKVSFMYGTLAALSKNGCNSGGCHGGAEWQGGLCNFHGRLRSRGRQDHADPGFLQSAHQHARAGIEPSPAQTAYAGRTQRGTQVAEGGRGV